MNTTKVPKSKKNIKSSNFKTEIDNESIDLYRLKNTNDLEVSITNFGQKIVSIKTPDRKGNFEDIVLGFANIEEYLNSSEIYFGAIIGRYANRIAQGKFSIDGIEYKLNTNNDTNHLHGGDNGFHNIIWDTEVISGSEIQFTHVSKHMEEGYPGTLMLRVHYELSNTNELKINYYAITDTATILNLTHHSYFNLSGEGNGDINDHILTINADRYTPVNKNLIPTGELATVDNTPFDFRKPKTIGNDIGVADEQLTFAKGYDHNFVLNIKEKELNFAARVAEPNSGRIMEVYTTEPGIQLYSGNFLNGKTIGKTGKPYVHRGAFCLETQHFPDSPNQANFPSTTLEPGETYETSTVYKFSIK